SPRFLSVACVEHEVDVVAHRRMLNTRVATSVPGPGRRALARSSTLRRGLAGTRVAPLERPCRVRRRARRVPGARRVRHAVRAGGVSTRVGGGLRDVVPRRAVLDAPALGLELDRAGPGLDRAARLRLRDARPLPHGRAAGRVHPVAALPGRGTRVRATDGRGVAAGRVRAVEAVAGLAPRAPPRPAGAVDAAAALPAGCPRPALPAGRGAGGARR